MLQHIDAQHGFPGLPRPRLVTPVSAGKRPEVPATASASPLYPVLVFRHDEPVEEVVHFGGRPFARTASGRWAMIDEIDVRGWAPEDRLSAI